MIQYLLIVNQENNTITVVKIKNERQSGSYKTNITEKELDSFLESSVEQTPNKAYGDERI